MTEQLKWLKGIEVFKYQKIWCESPAGKMMLRALSPRRQNHSFIHATNLLSTYDFFIKPSFRSPGIKGTQKPHSLVGMKHTSQLFETCTCLLWQQCSSGRHSPLTTRHLLCEIIYCPDSWSVSCPWPGHHPVKISQKLPVTSRISSKIQRVPKACFQNLFFHQCLLPPPTPAILN